MREGKNLRKELRNLTHSLRECNRTDNRISLWTRGHAVNTLCLGQALHWHITWCALHSLVTLLEQRKAFEIQGQRDAKEQKREHAWPYEPYWDKILRQDGLPIAPARVGIRQAEPCALSARERG